MSEPTIWALSYSTKKKTQSHNCQISRISLWDGCPSYETAEDEHTCMGESTDTGSEACSSSKYGRTASEAFEAVAGFVVIAAVISAASVAFMTRIRDCRMRVKDPCLMARPMRDEREEKSKEGEKTHARIKR